MWELPRFQMTAAVHYYGSFLLIYPQSLSAFGQKQKKSENDRYLAHTSFAHRMVGTVILALSEYGEILRYKNKIISSRRPKGATIPLTFRSIQAKRVQCKRTRQ